MQTKKNLGLSLIELMLGISIFLFALPAIMQTYFYALKYLNLLHQEVIKETELKYLRSFLINDLKVAQRILILSENKLNFQTIDNHVISYDLTEQKIRRKKDNNTTLYLNSILQIKKFVPIKNQQLIEFTFDIQNPQTEKINIYLTNLK